MQPLWRFARSGYGIPMLRLPMVLPPTGLLVLLVGCGGGTASSDRFGPECDDVRARAKNAAEAGGRLRQDRSTDSAAIESSARAYVEAVQSRPECFSAGQRDNAEQVGKTLAGRQPPQKVM